ncbi:TetR/AcrR family transcriptional regulator [Chloroflexota bacterium]
MSLENYTRGKRKQQIVDAVRKLIIERGASRTTVRMTAQEVGIAEPTIYSHFKSKLDILYSLVDDVEDDLLKSTTGIAIGDTADT